eukprot:TRINITY_DN39153_c0_g1_i1.p1 TRINITY_DN39153_c0_g1~~TRINITY_DN39153_c0_g1_i1.p1  ORF type:complete len:177 (-),score=31.71 TRINITY_DN39153_c0_g1_i1:230-760(-)
MGAGSSMLTQYDIEEVKAHVGGRYTHKEIVSLYERFCALDRNGKGFILADEFMSIPEFAINPLAQRLLRRFEGVNFKDFVGLLSAFSSRATPEDKARFIFRIFDVDDNGYVTSEDMVKVLGDLSGSFLTDEQRTQAVARALGEAGYDVGSCRLSPEDFCKILGQGVKMGVEIPEEY